MLVTERGFSFGYNNLVVDMRAFPMLRALGYPVVFDVTHSLQLPGGGDGVTAGLAEYIEPLASRRRRGRRRRRVHGSARGPGAGEERRAERARARSAGAAAAPTDAPRCGGAGVLTMSQSVLPDLALARRVLRTEADAILGLDRPP